MEDYTTKLVKFQDDNINIDKIDFTNNHVFIYASFRKIPDNTACPKCGSNNYHVHAYTTRKIKHSLIASKQSIIILKQPRLLCQEEICKTTFNAYTPIVKESRRLSNELLNDIDLELKTKRSFKDISEDYNISEKVVTYEFRQNLHNYRGTLSEVICIDEFKANTKFGLYAFVIGDPRSGRIIDVLPSRKQDYLIYYFQTISKDEKNKVKYIVSDLFEPFRTVIQAEFPNAIHIADRFHWIRLCTEAFNKQRIRIMNFNLHKANNVDTPKSLVSNYKQYAELLKNNYKLLLINKTNNPSWFTNQIVKKDKDKITTIQNIIESCINNDSNLEEGYSLLQELYRIAYYSNEETATNNLNKWIDKVLSSNYIIPELQKAALTYKSWINEICNSFVLDSQTHQRLASGFIEGKNNYIKVVKRISFGFKDFDLFRDRILSLNNHDVDKKNK